MSEITVTGEGVKPTSIPAIQFFRYAKLFDRIAGADAEVWVRNQVNTAIRMALAVKKEVLVRADSTIYDAAIFGIADGAAVEILKILGFDIDRLENLGK